MMALADLHLGNEDRRVSAVHQRRAPYQPVEKRRFAAA